jgi:hypothetical protein
MNYAYGNTIKALSNEDLVRIAPSIGSRKPHFTTSNKYAFVPTLTAVNLLRKDNWIPTAASEVAAKTDNTRGYQKHVIRFTRPDLVLKGRRMEMAMFNSHDGGSSFRLVAGLLEFICANSCVSGDKMAEYLHRHVGFNSTMFVEQAKQISGYLGQTTEKIEKWEAIELNPDERGVYCRSAHQAIYGDDVSAIEVKPEALLTRRRYSQAKQNDLWTTYQNCQENAIKGGLRGLNSRGGRASTRAVKSIDRDRKINQALWTITEHFAKYKMAA